MCSHRIVARTHVHVCTPCIQIQVYACTKTHTHILHSQKTVSVLLLPGHPLHCSLDHTQQEHENYLLPLDSNELPPKKNKTSVSSTMYQYGKNNIMHPVPTNS